MYYQNLYIHVPFCAHKCEYCAFFSVTKSTPDDWNCWLDRVVRDLQEHTESLQNLDSVYFGGGTPTMPGINFLQKAYARIFSLIGLKPDAEVSTEANPETLTVDKAQLLSQYFNRISMGVQSFNTLKRRTMGRYPENPESVYAAITALRKAGIENIGLDLIYGVSGETRDIWMNDLRDAVNLHPTHISTYSITPENGTAYAEKYGSFIDDDLSADMGHDAEGFLASQGYEKYEVSNFSKPGYQCRYNNGVWHGETYLGLGPSATSFDGTVRWTEQPEMTGWLNHVPPAIDRISRQRRVEEMLIMGLRTTYGWTRTDFEHATNGCSWDFATDKFLKLQRLGLLIYTGDECRATPFGLDFWDDIAECLLSDD